MNKNITQEICTMLEEKTSTVITQIDQNFPSMLHIEWGPKPGNPEDDFSIISRVVNSNTIKTLTFENVDSLIKTCANFQILAVSECIETEDGKLLFRFISENAEDEREFIKFLTWEEVLAYHHEV